MTEWLERTGAENPRGWLSCFRPLAMEFLHRKRVITKKEWRAARGKRPPPLELDDGVGVVRVGWRNIPIQELPAGQRALLEYLHLHRNRSCTRQELYYQAYQPLSQLDDAAEVREAPIDYDHILDSAISRLRKTIEPDPNARTYLKTVRGKGYRLEHAS